jgi:hypothetical protein
MKKDIQEVNNVLTSFKNITPVHDQKYIRRIWDITNHIALHSNKGNEQQIEIMTDLKLFLELLNEKYPIKKDEDEDVRDNRYLRFDDYYN